MNQKELNLKWIELNRKLRNLEQEDYIQFMETANRIIATPQHGSEYRIEIMDTLLNFRNKLLKKDK